MGNRIASKAGGWVTIMKLDGETIKLKAPVSVEQVVRDYPDYVALDSSTQLKSEHLYFLIEKPKIEDPRAPKRVRSDITMNAKSRLEAMLLARRSSSDIRMPTSAPQFSSFIHSGEAEGSMRVKVRMTKAQLTQFMAESNNSSETAEKILDFFLNDRVAQKHITATENIIEKPPIGMKSDAFQKAPRNRVRFSPDVHRVPAY